jgi:hypothetical protein
MEPDRFVLTVPGPAPTPRPSHDGGPTRHSRWHDLRRRWTKCGWLQKRRSIRSDCNPPDESIDFTFSLTDGALVNDVGPLRECDARRPIGPPRRLPSSSSLRCDEFSIEQTETGGSLRLVHIVAADREVSVPRRPRRTERRLVWDKATRAPCSRAYARPGTRLRATSSSHVPQPRKYLASRFRNRGNHR